MTNRDGRINQPNQFYHNNMVSHKSDLVLPGIHTLPPVRSSTDLNKSLRIIKENDFKTTDALATSIGKRLVQNKYRPVLTDLFSIDNNNNNSMNSVVNKDLYKRDTSPRVINDPMFDKQRTMPPPKNLPSLNHPKMMKPTEEVVMRKEPDDVMVDATIQDWSTPRHPNIEIKGGGASPMMKNENMAPPKLLEGRAAANKVNVPLLKISSDSIDGNDKAPLPSLKLPNSKRDNTIDLNRSINQMAEGEKRGAISVNQSPRPPATSRIESIKRYSPRPGGTIWKPPAQTKAKQPIGMTYEQ